MSLKKGQSNSGIKNLKKFEKGKSGYSFPERDIECYCCKKIFKSIGTNSKYCSIECKRKIEYYRYRGKYENHREWECEFCKKTFKRKNRSKIIRFCSRECYGLFTIANGKKNYFYRAFLNYPHKCDICGCDDYQLLTVHHKDINHENNEIINLQILCSNCHYRIHFGRGMVRKEKLNKIINYLKNLCL